MCSYIADADRCIDCDVPVFCQNLPVPENMTNGGGTILSTESKKLSHDNFKIYNGTSALRRNTVRTSYVLFSVVDKRKMA
jgi:hypothetical protein